MQPCNGQHTVAAWATAATCFLGPRLADHLASPLAVLALVRPWAPLDGLHGRVAPADHGALHISVTRDDPGVSMQGMPRGTPSSRSTTPSGCMRRTGARTSSSCCLRGTTTPPGPRSSTPSASPSCTVLCAAIPVLWRTSPLGEPCFPIWCCCNKPQACGMHALVQSAERSPSQAALPGAICCNGHALYAVAHLRRVHCTRALERQR